MSFDDGIAVQNVTPITSWPHEGMFEPYIALNTFFQCDDLSSENLIYTKSSIIALLFCW